jgi:NAD(P)-dependent dehydrogenase (short-subunit alcohol dehydrogenase family)
MPSHTAPVVLVTGAAKRLGRAIALHLAAAGWRVAVHYRSSEADAIDTIAQCDHMTVTLGKNHAFFADLSVEADCQALVPRVVAHMGRLDAVVNSAALFEHDTAQDFGYAAFQKHMLANAGAPIVLARALAAHVASVNESEALEPRSGEAFEPRTGMVVNLLDQKLWNQNPDFLSYTLSKAALEAANTVLAIALAPRVRVVGVAPGLTLTSHMLSEAQFKALHALSPLGRSSTAQDVCATVLFALTNQSITGTTLLVDGGQHLMRFERDFSLMQSTT